MKRDKLYTVNKWNQPLFADVDRRGRNIFDGLNGSLMQRGVPIASGYNPQFKAPDTIDLNGIIQKNAYNDYLNSSGNNWFGISKKNNPLSKVNIGATAKAAGGAAAALGSQIGVSENNKRGMYDVLDPIHQAAGGKESAVGNAFGDAGVGLFQAGASSGNPWLMAAGAAAKIVGGGINALAGIKENKENIATINSSIDAKNNLGNIANTASSNEELMTLADYLSAGTGFDYDDLYKGGIFSKGKAKRKGMKLINRENNALALQNYNYGTAVDKVDRMNDELALANFHAYGGPIYTMDNNDNMSAINYGFMQDYLTNKKQEIAAKNKMAGLSSMPSFMPQNSYAIGGDLQTNGADWSDGLTTIGAGGSHSENPNGGVQLGVDSEGTPNLVEEDETVYNDYVFSNRILADETTKQIFRLPKKKDISFSDISKRLEKEIAEHPNDPVSKAGFKAQMQQLEEQQERQKQEMEAARAREAFEALSPDEQVAVMQQAQQEEQMAQQAAMQEEAAMQQPSPEELAMAEQQQMAMADGSQPALGQEPQMSAEGGRINKFDKGGKKKNVGTWKDADADHWGIFTKPGLRRFLENAKAQIDMAPEDKKDAVRRRIMNEFNALQQSYNDYVAPTLGSDRYEYSEGILNHQKDFDRMYGNTGFYTTDDNGNVTNLIADAINLPKGAATEDKPSNWFDGYNGPRTSIRNFGSTEYGDDEYYKDLVKGFGELGLTYAPNENWKYGPDGGYQLYGLSLPEDTAAAGTAPTRRWDYNTGTWTEGTAPAPAVPGTATPTIVAATTPAGTGQEVVEPRHKQSWMRYAGLFGPAVGLGMQMAGIGRPDTGSIDAALRGSGEVSLANYKPIGNYLTYRPLDIWYEQNRLDANSRATDRAIRNSGSNQGAIAAGLLANGYNSQVASGNLFRQAQEYNDNLRKQVEDFNRGTNQFNAEAYNRLSQFNADARNRARQANAQMRLHAAAQKADMDAGWYNGIYGNVSGLFKGLSDLGRENEQFNWLADLAADGAFGNLGKSNTGRRWIKRSASKGGKIRRKKGLTI